MGGAGALVHLGEILAYVYGIWLYLMNSCAAAEVAAVVVDHVVNRRRCASDGPVTPRRLALLRVITPDCSSYGYSRMPC